MHHPQGLGVFQPRVIRSRRQTSPYPDPVPVSPHTTLSQAHEGWDLPSISPLIPIPTVLSIMGQRAATTSKPLQRSLRASFWVTRTASTQRILKKRTGHGQGESQLL